MTLIECLLPAKNILVYDVAASTSGALSVLNDFYNEVKNYDDKSIQWIFVISTPHLGDTENIKVIRLPWVKKSWIHRLICDYFTAPRLIKNISIDKVFSLQNVLVPSTNIPQALYLHQSLPFADYKFKITENFLFWVYQNVISKFIFSSLEKAEKVITQTEWMKRACVEKTGVNEGKIQVIPPKINISPRKFYEYKSMEIPTFIYPATPQGYKNHQIIIEASKQLVNEGVNDFEVIFTLTGNENDLSKRIFKEAEKYNLPIKFIGTISREELFEYYSKAILIFPSFIESYPLPLIEAMLHRTPVIAADQPFGREILSSYSEAIIFDKNSFDALVKTLKRLIIKTNINQSLKIQN